MNRGPRSFKYGARLKLTAPLGVMFALVTATMSFLALHSGPYMRVFDGGVAVVAAVLAVGMLRSSLTRLRGARKIVLGAQDITAPGPTGRARDVTVRYRDIKKLQMTGDPGYARVLKIQHASGELPIAGVMLGSTGELDEIHALLKAAKKAR